MGKVSSPGADETIDGHADRFWAAALMACAADLGEGEYDYIPVRPAGNDDNIGPMKGFRGPDDLPLKEFNPYGPRDWDGWT